MINTCVLACLRGVGLFFFFLILCHNTVLAQKSCPTKKEARPKTAARLKVEKAQVKSFKNNPGYYVFEGNCAPCHGVFDADLGPSMLECSQLYKGNKTTLITWLKTPARKRRGGAQMPPQTHLNAKQLDAVATWLLTVK
jgi:mono/diheme cytochrome c family protein